MWLTLPPSRRCSVCVSVDGSKRIRPRIHQAAACVLCAVRCRVVSCPSVSAVCVGVGPDTVALRSKSSSGGVQLHAPFRPEAVLLGHASGSSATPWPRALQQSLPLRPLTSIEQQARTDSARRARSADTDCRRSSDTIKRGAALRAVVRRIQPVRYRLTAGTSLLHHRLACYRRLLQSDTAGATSDGAQGNKGGGRVRPRGVRGGQGAPQRKQRDRAATQTREEK